MSARLPRSSPGASGHGPKQGEIAVNAFRHCEARFTCWNGELTPMDAGRKSWKEGGCDGKAKDEK